MKRQFFAATVVILFAAVFLFGAVYAWVWGPLLVLWCLLSASRLYLATREERDPPLSLPLLAAAAFGMLVTGQGLLGYSANPGESWTGLAQLGGAAAALLLAVDLFRTRSLALQWPRLARGLLLVLSVEAILQRVISPGKIYGLHDASYASPTGPYVYHNHFAGCLELLIPFALLNVLTSAHEDLSTTIRRLMIPLLGLSALVVSQSRAGLIVVAFQVLFVLLLAGQSGKLRRWTPLLTTGALLGALLLLGNWAPTLARLKTLDHHDASAAERLTIARAGLDLWRAHPIWGTGFNTFADVFPHYAQTDSLHMVIYAHDDFLQLLDETGIVGMIMALLFLGGVVVRVCLLARRRDDAVARIQFAAGVACLGLIAHAVVDFQFHAPANAWLFFFTVGLLLAPVEPPRGRSHPRTPLARSRTRELQLSGGAVEIR